jgi:hypothetical protein
MSFGIRISQPPPTPDGRPEATLGQVVVVAGLMLLGAVMLAWAGWTRHPGLHVPPGIAYVVSIVFVAGAAMFVLRALGHGDRLEPLVLLVLVGFTAISGWIALYGRSGSCQSSGPFFLPVPSCRVGFGASAVFTGMMAMAVIVTWRRRLRRGRRHPASLGHPE